VPLDATLVEIEQQPIFVLDVREIVRTPLPDSLKRRLRPLAQWAAVGVRQPQQLVEVRLVVGGETFDVTLMNVIATLRPLTIAIGLDDLSEMPVKRAAEAVLEFFDRDAAAIVYQVVDNRTSLVVRQFPEEAVLRRRAYFHALDLSKEAPTRLRATDRTA